ncbi:MAG: pirin family protein [Planctomycetota bacterium]
MKGLGKRTIALHRSTRGHWVGDGFPVHTLFDHAGLGRTLDPFVLLDHGGPYDFEPSDARRGVGPHPHRGFETVTLVYDGEVEHRDSAGGGGVIGPGDVQWMTAASGVVHAEFHGAGFARRGGRFEVAQLWVNLPSRHKTESPRYQSIGSDRIPEVELPDGSGAVRVVAGSYAGRRGPARTFTPIDVLDVRFRGPGEARFELGEGRVAALAVLSGEVEVDGRERVGANSVVGYSREGDSISVRATTASKLLVLAAEPLDEPVVGHGPFVMNSEDEIVRAIEDFRAGRMGRLDDPVADDQAAGR